MVKLRDADTTIALIATALKSFIAGTYEDGYKVAKFLEDEAERIRESIGNHANREQR